ncbi:hypothetical protein CKA32_001736 [Geitlerinema sp. FC II]|nr:hypothetical protein CKA32_001736 [Geitlerinema sp. FC II]
MALESSIFCIMLYIYNHKLRRPHEIKMHPLTSPFPGLCLGTRREQENPPQWCRKLFEIGD